jgi:quinol monooxygenase YgiN
MSAVVFIDRLERADSKRDALIGLLREFAESINADPECLNYSVHEPVDHVTAPLTVIETTAVRTPCPNSPFASMDAA